MSLELAYFYGSEAEQYSFYRIPKVLLIDWRYRGVSMETKVLYGLMLDRMGLSVRSGWLDDEGRVYIYFTLDDALSMLGCGKDKAVRLFKELDVSGGIGLIERPFRIRKNCRLRLLKNRSLHFWKAAVQTAENPPLIRLN